MLASALMDARSRVTLRRAEHADVARVLRSTGLPLTAVFFADRPGLNRMNGRLDWVYDDWLYPVFESPKLAEPRARWLRPLLGDPAAVRAVVLESDGPRLDGIPEPLPRSASGPRAGSGRFASGHSDILTSGTFMSETPTDRHERGGRASAWITAILAVSAAAHDRLLVRPSRR